MKKAILLTAVLLLALSLTVSGAAIGQLEWTTENGTPGWEVTEEGTLKTVPTGSNALTNYSIAVNNGEKISGDFEVEVDMPMVEYEYVTITVNAGSVNSYSGSMIKLHPTYGIIFYDIDSAITTAPEYASTTDTLAGIDQFEPFQRLKITKAGKLLTIYVNGVKNFEFTPANCDETGMIVLGAQINGNTSCEFKNFKLTANGQTYTDFESTGASVSSVPETPASSGTDADISSTASSNPSVSSVGTASSKAENSGNCGNSAE